MKGSFGIPDSCTSSDDCDFLVTYQNVVDNVEFELSGKAGWAGVGFSDDTNMADTDILICASDRSKSGHYYAEGRSTPPMTRPTPSAVTIIEHSNDGGVVKCKISRDIYPGINNFRDLSKPWFLLGAIGYFNGGQIQQHSIRRPTNFKIVVTDVSGKIQHNSVGQPTNSSIVVTDASGSASGSGGIKSNFIVLGKTIRTQLITYT
ncbi:hypothetical protein ACROYT_G006481 [Oculina patagonica]